MYCLATPNSHFLPVQWNGPGSFKYFSFARWLDVKLCQLRALGKHCKREEFFCLVLVHLQTHGFPSTGLLKRRQCAQNQGPTRRASPPVPRPCSAQWPAVLGGPWKCYAERNKPNTKGQLSYDSTCIKYLEEANLWRLMGREGIGHFRIVWP